MSTSFRNRSHTQAPGGLGNDPENPVHSKARLLNPGKDGVSKQKARSALGDIRNVNSVSDSASKNPKKGLSISNANPEKNLRTPLAPRSNLIRSSNSSAVKKPTQIKKQSDAIPTKETWTAFVDEDSDDEEIDTCHRPRERRTSLDMAAEDYFGPKEERLSAIPMERWTEMLKPPGVITGFDTAIDPEDVMKELEELGLFG